MCGAHLTHGKGSPLSTSGLSCSSTIGERFSMQAGKVGSGFEASGLVLPHQRILESRQAKRKRVHWPVALFLIALVVPWIFYFGTLRMTVYRIVLLLMFLPCLTMWMLGKAGRIRI